MPADRRDAAGFAHALFLGCWLSYFSAATAVSAVTLAEARPPAPAALPAPDLHFHPPRAAPDVRLLVALGYSTLTSGVLLVLGLGAALRFVVGRK